MDLTDILFSKPFIGSQSGEDSGGSNTNGMIKQTITIEDGVVTSGEFPDWLISENSDYIFGTINVDGVIEHLDSQTGQDNGEEESVEFKSAFNRIEQSGSEKVIVSTFFGTYTHPSGVTVGIIGVCQIINSSHIIVGWRDTYNNNDINEGILKSGTVNIVLYFDAEHAQYVNNKNNNNDDNDNNDNEERIDS